MPSRNPPRPLLPTLLREPRRFASAPWDTLPPPLATGARTLGHHAGPCAVCGRALLAGQRAADLAGGGIVHVGCAGRAA